MAKNAVKTVNYFNTFNHRPAKVGMSNDYGLLYRLMDRYLVVIVSSDPW